MRHGCALALTILFPLLSPALRAQDPEPPERGADSMVPDSSDSRMLSDSSDLEEEVADTLLRRLPEQVGSGPHPYLREVRDRAKPVWWESIALGAGSRAHRYPGAGVTYGPGSTGGTLTAEVGRRFNQHAGLGLEYIGWLGDFQEDFFGALQSLFAIVRVHPLGAVGPFLKAGGGLATYGVYDMVYDELASFDVGVAYVVGAGWDIPMGRELVISPIVEWQHFTLASDRTYHGKLLNVGLMITWSGRESDLDQLLSEE
jgi:hypothetical protein